MASVENLVDALEQYHVHYFLIIYLTLIQQGCSLEVPQSIELEKVSFQWKNALLNNVSMLQTHLYKNYQNFGFH